MRSSGCRLELQKRRLRGLSAYIRELIRRDVFYAARARAIIIEIARHTCGESAGVCSGASALSCVCVYANVSCLIKPEATHTSMIFESFVDLT